MTKHKEYLDTSYELRSVKQTSGDNQVPKGWIEVPEWAEEYRTNHRFYKNNGKLFYATYGEWGEWVESGLTNFETLWKRGTVKRENKTKVPHGSNREEVMKEFLNPEQGYALVKCFVGETPIPESWIEVPEGAEIFLLDKSFGEDTLSFVKHDGDVFHEYYIDTTGVPNNVWIKGTIKVLHKDMGEVLWQRSPTTLDSKDTTTKEKLKFIEKWLNGEKIQYILGVESEKTQWHNFTEGAMQYIKRSDIKFREAPKYVTINGIEFKSVESLLKHVKNNFDLEDGE